MNNNEKNNSTGWLESLSQRDKRSLIFHVLYAAESNDYQVTIDSLIDNLNRGFDLEIPLNGEIATTAGTIIKDRDILDDTYKPFLANWRLERIGVCTKLILRYAIWELNNTQTTPIIIINEAIELAKCFAEKDAYKFINGVLDEIVKAQSGK